MTEVYEKEALPCTSSSIQNERDSNSDLRSKPLAYLLSKKSKETDKEEFFLVDSNSKFLGDYNKYERSVVIKTTTPCFSNEHHNTVDGFVEGNHEHYLLFTKHVKSTDWPCWVESVRFILERIIFELSKNFCFLV